MIDDIIEQLEQQIAFKAQLVTEFEEEIARRRDKIRNLKEDIDDLQFQIKELKGQGDYEDYVDDDRFDGDPNTGGDSDSSWRAAERRQMGLTNF